jgi:hypothetical protein
MCSLPFGLKFGIDAIDAEQSADGVVRYVIVARSATGAVNALYEGIRCATGQVRTYARKNAAANPGHRFADGDWRSIRDGQRSVHAGMRRLGRVFAWANSTGNATRAPCAP